MKAIQTRYLAPTNHRGARVKAFAKGGNQVIGVWGYGLSVYDNHRIAACRLMCKMDWIEHSKISGHGVLPCGDHVFTMTDKTSNENNNNIKG